MSKPRYVRDAHVEIMTNKFKTGKLGGRGYAAVKAEPGEDDFEEDQKPEPKRARVTGFFKGVPGVGGKWRVKGSPPPLIVGSQQ